MTRQASMGLACLMLLAIIFDEHGPPSSFMVASSLTSQDRYHRPVMDRSIDLIFNLSNPAPTLNFDDPNSLLSKILIPRPVESQNLTDCRSLFKQHFKALSNKLKVPPASNFYINSAEPPSYSPVPLTEIETWQLESHSFTSQTPYGIKSFENLIFTYDPTAPLRVVLAAHMDSKFFPHPPDNQFIGATDSAAPLAIILEVARALTSLLDRKLAHDLQLGENGMTSERMTLQIILLDGEEAFENWSSTDSIYGARALAEKWSKLLRLPNATMKRIRTLDQIDTFILYDLLGSPNPSIHNFFEKTSWLYDSFRKVENRLQTNSFFTKLSTSFVSSNSKVGQKKLIDPNYDSSRSPFFAQTKFDQPSVFSSIEDDHLPFLREGVPVLHLIAAPFPQVWHTIKDDRSALDLQTILEWNLISQVALVEYLGLETFLDGYLSGRRDEL